MKVVRSSKKTYSKPTYNSPGPLTCVNTNSLKVTGTSECAVDILGVTVLGEEGPLSNTELIVGSKVTNFSNFEGTFYTLCKINTFLIQKSFFFVKLKHMNLNLIDHMGCLNKMHHLSMSIITKHRILMYHAGHHHQIVTEIMEDYRAHNVCGTLTSSPLGNKLVEYKWTFNDSSNFMKLKVRKKLRDASKNMSLSKLALHNTDYGIGNYIANNLNYGAIPWINSDIQSQSLQHTLNSNGNFSVIIALHESFFLGVMNSSHRVTYNEAHHLGSVSIVECPATCMIVLRSSLYYYGDRAIFGDVSFQLNMRLFAYMSSPNHNFGDITQNFPATNNNFCQGCEKCFDVESFLKEHRSLGDGHKRWPCPLRPSEISKLEPGAHIMGDLNMLGWAIIKGYEVSPYNRITLIDEMKYVKHGLQKPNHHGNCIAIQSYNDHHSHMQYPSLVNRSINEELFVDELGLYPERRMYLPPDYRHEFIKELPLLSLIFDKDLELLCKYVRYNTTIKCNYIFTSHNIISNYKGIREQNVHTDYPKTS